MFTCVLGRWAASTVILVPNLSEGADRVGGQLRGDKECPFNDVTKSGRVWRKVPASDARSVNDVLSDLASTVLVQNLSSLRGAGIAQWLERRTRD